jgi:hypothetical protein
MYPWRSVRNTLDVTGCDVEVRKVEAKTMRSPITSSRSSCNAIRNLQLISEQARTPEDMKTVH